MSQEAPVLPKSTQPHATPPTQSSLRIAGAPVEGLLRKDSADDEPMGLASRIIPGSTSARVERTACSGATIVGTSCAQAVEQTMSANIRRSSTDVRRCTTTSPRQRVNISNREPARTTCTPPVVLCHWNQPRQPQSVHAHCRELRAPENRTEIDCTLGAGRLRGSRSRMKTRPPRPARTARFSAAHRHAQGTTSAGQHFTSR